MARTITADEFEDLYRATAPEVLGYLRRRAGSEATDLMSEVYIIAWRRRDDMPAEILRRAWLFGTARRLLLADHRRADREAQTAQSLSVSVAAGSGPPSVDDSRSTTVHAALGRLSELDRDLVTLTEWEGMTPGEAAMVTGIRPGTARVRLHRARQTLAADPYMRGLLKRTRESPDVVR